MDKLTSIGILTVATNKYVEYWKKQAKSISDSRIRDLEVTLHVFTDDTEAVESFSRDLDVNVVAHEIPSLGWPDATLMRYRIITQFSQSIKEDILMHLDADMLLHHELSQLEITREIKNGICLVLHPGYYRPKGLKLVKLYSQHPKTALMDLHLLTSKGGLGLWESRVQSMAYVPRLKRKRYFCGGTWWGYRENILKLCEELARRIESDQERGEMAVWHDESHLNWWAHANEHGFTTPRYCYAFGYPQLEDLTCVIEAVHK
jgi:hypothetical protein